MVTHAEKDQRRKKEQVIRHQKRLQQGLSNAVRTGEPPGEILEAEDQCNR